MVVSISVHNRMAIRSALAETFCYKSRLSSSVLYSTICNGSPLR